VSLLDKDILTAQRIYGYLAKMKHAALRVRTGEPDYSDVEGREYDWIGVRQRNRVNPRRTAKTTRLQQRQ
jgi:hypothetical protein